MHIEQNLLTWKLLAAAQKNQIETQVYSELLILYSPARQSVEASGVGALMHMHIHK